MEDKNKKLITRVEELEKIIEDKEIIINLLLNEVKRFKKGNEIEPTKEQKFEESIDIYKDITVENLDQEIKNNIEEDITWSYKHKLKEELECLLKKKKITKIFKDSMFFDEYSEFCSDNFTFNSFEDCQSLIFTKNMKKYTTENKRNIFRYLIQEINKLSLNTLCTTLLTLSGEFEELEKLVLINDIILHLEDNSRLLFLIYALVNQKDFFKKIEKEDIFKNTIFNILNVQYVIDMDIHKSKKIITSSLQNIKSFLGFKILHVKLEDILINMNSDMPVILNFKINEDIYQFMYSVRVLGHFLDWDYVYNTYITEYLCKETNGCKLLYLGMLWLNSLRLFGLEDSNKKILDYFIYNMIDEKETSITSYLFVKQINSLLSDKYINENCEKLGNSKEYLKNIILF